jgi:2,4-didehydro-3-deoxy-L-rhamnonate hydrolase
MRVGNLSGRLALISGAGAVDVEKASEGRFEADPAAIYARWPEFTEWAATAHGEAVRFEKADLRAPSPRPAQIFAIAANYGEHVAEANVELPVAPVIFTKYVSSINGPFADIAIASRTVDWEAELVVVIGKRAYQVSEADVWSYVAGVTAGQDISERTTQRRTRPFSQMSLAKSFPGFSPFGPWLVTPDELADPDDLRLCCSLNGEVVQGARTSGMAFPVPTLIAEISAVLPLEPGDVIFTGTPGGVGMLRNPPRYLAVGDELVTSIEGIGEMRHHIVAS